jgi:hypothetical protein
MKILEGIQNSIQTLSQIERDIDDIQEDVDELTSEA